MAAATVSALFTPDDLLRLGREKLFELVGGQLVEKQTSFLAGKCAAAITYILLDYLKNRPGGEVASEVTFQCFPHDEDLVRRPDIAFVSKDRAGAIPAEGHIRIAPDLAIEIISPNDRINDFEDKLADYRSAGIKLVWEVNPTFGYVRVHRPDRTSSLLEAEDTLSGESILPGFAVKVGELMPASASHVG